MCFMTIICSILFDLKTFPDHIEKTMSYIVHPKQQKLPVLYQKSEPVNSRKNNIGITTDMVVLTVNDDGHRCQRNQSTMTATFALRLLVRRPSLMTPRTSKRSPNTGVEGTKSTKIVKGSSTSSSSCDRSNRHAPKTALETNEPSVLRSFFREHRRRSTCQYIKVKMRTQCTGIGLIKAPQNRRAPTPLHLYAPRSFDWKLILCMILCDTKSLFICPE